MIIAILAVISAVASIIWFKLELQQQKIALDKYRNSLDQQKLNLDKYKASLNKRQTEVEKLTQNNKNLIEPQASNTALNSPSPVNGQWCQILPSPQKQASRVIQYSPKLQQLLNLLEGDTLCAKRLLENECRITPGKPDDWYIDKVLIGLKRNQRS